MVNTLRQNKVEFYTYNRKKFRPLKIVIKYIPTDTPTEDIETALREKNFPFHQISRIMLSKDGRKIPSNILLLTIPKEAAQAYYALEELCYLKVTASDYVRLELSQCHRCQKIGHSSQLCNRAFRCVRCGGGHAGEPCTTPACKCANCGAEHPASYRGCPIYTAAKARQNLNQILPPTRATPSAPTRPARPAVGATHTPTHTTTQRANTRPPPPSRTNSPPNRGSRHPPGQCQGLARV